MGKGRLDSEYVIKSEEIEGQYPKEKENKKRIKVTWNSREIFRRLEAYKDSGDKWKPKGNKITTNDKPCSFHEYNSTQIMVCSKGGGEWGKKKRRLKVSLLILFFVMMLLALLYGSPGGLSATGC